MVPVDSHRISRVPRYSGYCYQFNTLPVQDYHLLRSNFPLRFQFSIKLIFCSPTTPIMLDNIIGLGYYAFARHYLRNHFCFLFLWVLRCFSSPRSPPAMQDSTASLCWVAPFGYLGICSYLHLPQAFRSLSRPSSPPRAKASTVRSYLLFCRSIPINILLLIFITTSFLFFPICQRP